MKRNLVTVIFLISAVVAFAGGTADTQTTAAFNRTGMPIVNEPVTLRMSANLYAANTPYPEMAFFKMMEETTGVNIDWELIPQEAYQERKNLMLAGGDLPDAMYKSGLSDYDMLTYTPQGAFLAIDDYLASGLLPNASSILSKRPEVKGMMTLPDGKLYSLPWIEEMKLVYSDSFLHVSKPWLENLGMDPPETTEEFVNMLRRFKNEDANNNGDPNDEVPFMYMPCSSKTGHASGINFMLGSFGMDDNQEHIVVRNDKVLFTGNKDGYIAAHN